MLKRSLALGALMAFVITGQAWATENIIVNEGKNETFKDTNIVFEQSVGSGVWTNAVEVAKNATVTFDGSETNITSINNRVDGYTAQGVRVGHNGSYAYFNADKTTITSKSYFGANGVAGGWGTAYFTGSEATVNVIVLGDGVGNSNAIGIMSGLDVANSVDKFSVYVNIGSGVDSTNPAASNGTAGIYASNMPIKISSNELIVDVRASGENHTGNTYGLRADDTVSLNTAMVVDSKKIDIDVVDNVANAYGVRANCNNCENGSGTYYDVYGEIELGGANSVITIDATANNGFAVGIAAHRANDKNKENASSVTVNGKSLVINATGKTAYGVLGMNNTTGSAKKVSTVTINSADTTINAKAGLVALSQSKINVNGNLTVNSEGGDAIVSRGGATVNINAEGKDRVVKLTGDIDFNYDEATSGTPIDATVNLNLTNADSFFTGKIYKSGNPNLPADKSALSGMNISLSNGAKWNLTGESVVSNATFGKDSVLNIKGADFDASTKTAYALNASEGSPVLKVEQGAKLAIEGIEENVTYNIANGFAVDKTVGENWIIDNNLLTGDWSDTKGLQVTTRAKEAGEIASDMGVSGGTADALAGIINAVNDVPATTKAQENVKAFAEAIVNATPEQAADAANAVVKMAEAGGNNATAASIVKNVTGVTNDRLSFNCGHSAPHKGGHGVGLFEEGSGADVWVEYVHGKDEVEDMPSSAGASSYEGQYNGIVMGVDFKKVNKFQSGIAFNYGEGDTNSVGTSARTHSDYDFWGIGYYGNIHNDDSNVIFDINYAKSDSDVTNKNLAATYEASPETTTWTAGVKVEKLYQNENVQIVPYTGLRYMSIDADDYATKCGTFNYKMDRQDIWLLPVGVSIRQEIANDNGWTVSPRVDLSYIWAFGDTDSNMEFATAFNNKVTNIGYDVMDDGSFLGLVGIEAHKGQWGYGIAYSYQKGDHSESKKWYVDVNYSF